MNQGLLSSRVYKVLFTACLFSMSSGCRDTTIEDGVAALNKSRIQQLYNCYSLYGHYNQYRGPKDEAEFKEFLLRPKYEKNLKLMKIDRDSLDDLFVSDRDGEPFRIRYGVNGLGNKAVIFEAKGVEGQRMIAVATPKEVDAAEYDAYWSGKKRPESTRATQGASQ
ncbi:MAG: hypothetical protein AAGD11_09215 [Planctomycetota bacterium]